MEEFLMNAAEIIEGKLADIGQVLSPVPGFKDSFIKCFLNTAQTTLTAMPDGTSFVITGDIPAMWLRDSTAQVLHYMRFLDEPHIDALILGLIKRQAYSILLDPYANAFNMEANGAKFTQDEPCQDPEVWERKFEVDSLCYPILLADKYYQKIGSKDFIDETILKAFRKIYEVFKTEQKPAESPYYFIRHNCPPQDTMSRNGRGEPLGYTGMIRSGFRPSDDACKYGYLIPANLFAAITLKRIAHLTEDIMGYEVFSEDCLVLAGEVEQGIDRYATMTLDGQSVYAYETDGLGNYLFMDDANVPSLLSLPYLEVCGNEDQLYISTRKAILSHRNPFYYEGTAACGVGSPHTPHRYIWPISLCMRALTSTDDDEIYAMLKTLATTDAGTGFMHEGFDADDPEKYTRSWFAWANSLFGELVYRLYENGKLEGFVKRLETDINE
jgi:uncharacterized protein